MILLKLRACRVAAKLGLLLLPLVWSLKTFAIDSNLERSSFVYDVFRSPANCSLIRTRLSSLEVGATAILSIEDGPVFLLDRPDGAEQLACAIEAIATRHKRAKLLLLQDVSFLDNVAEAERRVAIAARFVRAHPDLQSTLVIDIEPYVTERWSCGGREVEAQIAQTYLKLARDLRSIARPVPLEAAVPWWSTVERTDFAFSAAALATVLDGEYLMFYGDEGGPVVNGSMQRLLQRFPQPTASSIPTRFYIALATYEAASRTTLENEVAQLEETFGRLPNYAGTAIFQAGGTYDAPLVRTLSSAVVDPSGRGLANAQISAGALVTHTNHCGQFVLRGLPESAALTLTAPGYEVLRKQVDQLRPSGFETDWPRFMLHPLPK